MAMVRGRSIVAWPGAIHEGKGQAVPIDRLVCAAGRSNHPAKAFSGPLCWVADHMLNAPTPAITARARNIPVEDPREAAREDVRLGERDGERVLRFLLAI